jgi:hypothetical protein
MCSRGYCGTYFLCVSIRLIFAGQCVYATPQGRNVYAGRLVVNSDYEEHIP